MEPSWARSPQAQTKSCLDIGIVGRIALFRALQDRSKPWIWTIDLAFTDGRDQTHGFEASREAAMEAFTRCWFRENKT